MTRTDAELLIASRDDPRAFREVAGDLLAETFAVAYERCKRFRDVGAPGRTNVNGRRGGETRAAVHGALNRHMSE